VFSDSIHSLFTPPFLLPRCTLTPRRVCCAQILKEATAQVLVRGNKLCNFVVRSAHSFTHTGGHWGMLGWHAGVVCTLGLPHGARVDAKSHGPWRQTERLKHPLLPVTALRRSGANTS
jgi:hypothetical protein